MAATTYGNEVSSVTDGGAFCCGYRFGDLLCLLAYQSFQLTLFGKRGVGDNKR